MKSPLLSLLASLVLTASAVAQSVTITPSATTYSSAGGQITVSVAFGFATPTSLPKAIAFEVTAPVGWSYGSGYVGDVYVTRPSSGSTGPLGFAFAEFEDPPPTVAGKTTFSFKLNYQAGLTGTQTLPITVAQYKDDTVGTINVNVPSITLAPDGGGTVAAPVISSATTATATVGTAFSYQITASNSPTSYAATGLPAGLSINATSGLINGTPTTAGTSNVSLTATNAVGTSAAVTLILTVIPPAPVISSTTTASATVGAAFSYQITASNSPTSYASSGLPSGLSLNTTSGLISGTPTAAGTSNVTISATNAGGTSASVTLVLNVSAPPSSQGPSVQITPSATTYSSAGGQITVSVAFGFATPTSLPKAIAFEVTAPAGWSYGSGYVGDVYVTRPTSGSTGPLGFAFAEFEDPPPTVAGKTTFSFKLNYQAGLTGTQTLPITVAQYKDDTVGTINVNVPSITVAPDGGGTVAAPVISSATTATATVGTAFSYQITASNSPTSFAATGLPAGLSINATSGLINGTPTTAGTSTVSLTATNSGGTSSALSLVLTVNPAPVAPTISTQPQSQTVTAGSPVTFTVVASGSSPLSYQWKKGTVDISSATNASYTIQSTVSADAGSYFVTVTNPGGSLTSNAAALTVTAAVPAPVISSATTATATVGTAFSYQITASNSPTSYAATGLPSGLSVNATSGLISGTPTTAGSSTVSLTATNSGGTSSALSLVLTVNPAPVAPTISTQPQSQTVTAGSPVTFTVVASGSSPLSYQWKKGAVEITGATNASYTIQSTVSADAGSYFVTVTNPGGSLTSNAAALTVTAAVPAPVISSATTATATVGTAFSYQITASNSPTSYAATGLPAGLSINTTTGLISGTPTAAGTSTVTLTATNTGGTSSPFGLALTVTASSSGFAFSQQPAAITRNRGETASFTVNTTGGTGTVTYKWYKNDVALQDVFGRITGSGSANLVISNVGSADAGSYSATAATVQNGTINSTGAALTVLAGPTITRAVLDSSAQVNGSVSFSVSATGSGTLSYKWLFTAKNSSSPVQISDVSGRFAGSATSTLAISAVASGDEGFYTCEVTDSAGVARSSGYLSVVSRIIRVVSQSAAPGSNVTVVVQLLATGVENAAGFSLQFDSSKLTYVAASAVLGTQASDATLVPNEASATQGRLGFAIAKPANAAWQAGTNELLKLTFSLKSTLTSVDFCVIGFGQSPVAQEVVGVDALVLPTGFSAGVITPLAGFEADINGSGTVTISDWVKIGRIVAGLDPRPTGVDFLKADCAPRLNTDSTLRLGGGTLSIADWVQAGRYAAGLDPLTAVGGPTDTQNP